MRRKRSVAGCSLALLLLVLAPLASAQDQPAEPPPQDTPADTPPAATPPADDAQAEPAAPEEKKKNRIKLYIEAGFGSYQPDDVNSSIESSSTAFSKNILTFDDQIYSRAAIGWRLPTGDIRLIFTGYSEDGYKLESTGSLQSYEDSPESPDTPIPWWTLEVVNGTLNSFRTPPQPGGNTYPGCSPSDQPCLAASDLQVNAGTFKDLQNRAQTYDLVYGDVWGPRRIQGRWLGGFRYFQYDGNIPSAAWLFFPPTGQGFTDGALLRLLNFRQETKGLGPTGLLEARFNFFDQRLHIYINGQATFLVNSIKVDSGLFTTLVQRSDGITLITSPSRLEDKITKSSWHTGAEIGLRWKFKYGLGFELNYGIVGFLDAIYMPTRIRVPENTVEADQGTSAIYNTQDYVLDGWRAGISYQF